MLWSDWSVLRTLKREGDNVHADNDTGIERELRRERGEQRPDRTASGTDVVPVQREREQTETLVTGGTTEDAIKACQSTTIRSCRRRPHIPSDPCAMLRGKAEDRDAGESGRNVLREPFPYETRDHTDPEETHTFLL